MGAFVPAFLPGMSVAKMRPNVVVEKGNSMPFMTIDQIPHFIDDLVALGCNPQAISPDRYVIGDTDIPLDEYEAIEGQLILVCKRYGKRENLRIEIARYLHSIGRSTLHP